jgi:hypothetical protein
VKRVSGSRGAPWPDPAVAEALLDGPPGHPGGWLDPESGRRFDTPGPSGLGAADGGGPWPSRAGAADGGRPWQLRADTADGGSRERRIVDVARLLAAAARPLDTRPGDEAAALAAFRQARGAAGVAAPHVPGGADDAPDAERARALREGSGAWGAADGRGSRAARAAADGARVPRGVSVAADDRRARDPRSASAGPALLGGMLRRMRHRGLTAKAFVGGAAAVLALGGVALAAQSGGLPRPFHHGHAVTPRPSAPSLSPPVSPSVSAPVVPGPSATQAEPPAVPGGSASPAPSLTSRAAPEQGAPGSRQDGDTDAGAGGVKGLCGTHLRDAAEGCPLNTPDLGGLTPTVGDGAGRDGLAGHGNTKPSPGSPSITLTVSLPTPTS